MYITRDIALKAQKYIKDDEIMLFIGARQAGKTTILRQLEEYIGREIGDPCVFINFEDPELRSLIDESPKNLFDIAQVDYGKRTVFFVDEVQYLKDPSNFLKYFYDEYKGRIKMIVSGSSSFYLDKKFKDSLAGRKRIFNVYTFSFPEFLRAKGKDDLIPKIHDKLVLTEREQIMRLYSEYMQYGGYPRVVLASLDEKKNWLKEIAYSYIKKDVLEANIQQEKIFYKMLKILASQVGQLVNASELASTLDVSKTMIDRYLLVMQKSFHLALVPPFSRNMRKELTKMPKVFFYDLGLRNFLLNNFESFAIREDKGQLLENASFRHLILNYGQDEIYFWRTIQKHEIDFVIQQENIAFEVKATPERVNTRPLKIFSEHYPKIPIEIITFNSDKKEVKGIPVKNVWEV